MNNGLIPGGTSFKRERQSVFFTHVNPMDDQNGLRETLCKTLGNAFKILYVGAI